MKNKILSFVGMRVKGRKSNDPLITHYSPTNHPLLHQAWKYTTCMLMVLAMSIGNVWGEDFTITPITSSYNYTSLAKVTINSPEGSTLKIGSGQIQTNSKNDVGYFTISTTLSGLYIKKVSFIDGNKGNANKLVTLEKQAGDGTLENNATDATWTYSGGTTSSVTFKLTAGSGGGGKLGTVSITVASSENNIETLSGFSLSSGTYSFTAKVNDATVTSAVSLTTPTSSGGSVSGTNISLSSNRTITFTSENNIKYIAFFDTNCRATFSVDAGGGTCDGGTWTANANTKTVTLKNAAGTSLSGLSKVFVVTESPCAEPSITTQPTGATIEKGATNPTLSVTASNTTSYAWKESSDGEITDGNAILATTASFTPEVNDAEQTKYYYCELVNSCDAGNIVRTNIVAVNVVGSITHVTGVSLDKTEQEFTLDETTTATLTATVAPDDADDKSISWSSSAPAIVSVTDNGDGTAGIEGLAEGTATITVTTTDGSFAATCDVTVHPNPCATYFWFVATTDAANNGKTNWDGFTGPTGSNGQTSNPTIDGTQYTLTKRTGSTGAGVSILDFTIPAGKAGTLYGYMKSSGSAARTLSLKKGDDVVMTNTEITNGDWTLITMSGIASGTYTLSPDQNVQIQMFVLKVCDATYHTITLDWGSESGPMSVSVIDGGVATQPADPTWEHHRFDGWYNGATLYDWTANVTGDITLTAHWTQLYTISFAAEGGSGDAPAAIEDKAQGETFTVPANTFTAPDGKEFDKWSDGTADYAPGVTYTVGTANVTLTAQWKALAAKYTVIYKDGDDELEREPVDVGNKPAGVVPEKDHFTFVAWQSCADNIALDDDYWLTVEANTEVILTAHWTEDAKAAVTFRVDGEQYGVQNVYLGEKVAAVDAPAKAGNVFRGWYNGESKFDFSAEITEWDAITLDAKWEAADPNHYVYAYNDDTRFDGVVYHTPEGKVDNGNGNETLDLTSPYTLFEGAEGITSIVAVDAVYDSKGKDARGAAIQYVTAMLKLNNNSTSKLTITIKSGHTATLKIKSSGFSATRTISVSNATPASATTTGNAVGSSAPYANTNGELTFALTSGTHDITVTGGTLYISELDVVAEALTAYTVTYKAGEGTGDDVVDDAATEVADVPGTFTAPEGKIFNGWKDESDADVAVGTIVSGDMTLTAQWIRHFAVTFDLQGHGEFTIEPQDVREGALAIEPANLTEVGYEFGGWFTDPACTEGTEFDFNTPITTATALFAKWTAFEGCVLLVPATSGEALSNGDDIVTQIGSMGAEFKAVAKAARLTYTANGLQFGNESGVKAGVTLSSNTLKEGTKISITLVSANTGTRGLFLYDATGANKVAELGWSNATEGAEEIFTYTVTGTDKLVGTNGFQLWRNNTVILKKLTVTNCGAEPVTVTFKNADETLIEEKVIEKDTYVTAPVAPRICGSHLTGWSETVDGELVDLTTTAINADKTFYPVYAVNTQVESGTVYKFQLRTNLTSGNMFATAPLPATAITTENYLSELTGGELEAENTNGNANRIVISDNKAIGFSGGSGGKLSLYLNEPLQAKDEIRFINYASTNNSITLSDGTNSITLSGNSAETVQTISVPAAWVETGSCVLTMVRGSNTAKLTYFEIYRRPELTGASLEDLTMRVGLPKTPVLHLLPSDDAIVTSQAWEIVGEPDNLTGAAIDPATGEITSGTLDDPENNGTIQVKVTLNGTIVATCTVTVVNAIAQQDVTKSTSWDWKKTGAAATIQLSNSTDPKKNEGFVLANAAVNNDADFESDKLYVEGEHIVREPDKANPYFQGQTIKFKTTVEGAVKLTYSNTGNNAAREVYVNDAPTGYSSAGTALTETGYIKVPAGEVSIKAYNVDPASGASQQNLRIYKVEFLTLEQRRTYSWIRPSELGTVCLKNDAVAVGADIYELQGPNEHGKLVFDQILSGEIAAGKPYLFSATATGEISFYTQVNANHTEDAGNTKGMYGTFEDKTFDPTTDQNIYYFSGHAIYGVKNWSTTVTIPAHLCYVDMEEFKAAPAPSAAPAPGRRRITLDVQGEQVATGLENDGLMNDGMMKKVLINGQLFILRGEKIYDATGRLVK